MKDRDQQDTITPIETEQPSEAAVTPATPVLDMDVFLQLRDVIRNHYLWKWGDNDEDTDEVINDIPNVLHDDPRFRLVGDVEIAENVFEITLWLQDSMAFSLSAVDVMVLDALEIDLGKGTVIARELTRMGLEYHVITFGDGRARQLLINVIGPRMQQIRDLGRLVVPTMESFSA